MSDHLSIPIPKGIQEAIIKNKLVLFIGSGMSQQLGFPSWRNLTNDILDQLSQENPKYIKLKDSLEAGFETDLEALGKVYGLRSQVLEILDRTFSINYEALDLRLHRKLGLISSKIITTNYDKALEHANPSFKKIKHNDEYRLSKLPETNGFIFKLHGCIDSPETCILFKQDYNVLYDKPSLALEELKKFISDHTILFIGFSLDDDYVIKQFDYISNLYKGLKGKHYIITTQKGNILDDNIIPITINNWSEITIVIDAIFEFKKQKFIPTDLELPKEEVDSTFHNLIKFESKKPRIALLILDSLDKKTEYSFNKLIKPFNTFYAEVSCYYFSAKILNEIEDFDYIFIFTKTWSQKIFIEDRYLKSKLITLKEFESELLQQTFKAVIFFTDDINIQSDNTNLPIILEKYTKDTYEHFIFKVFRKGNVNKNELTAVNLDKINIELFSSGKSTVKFAKTKTSKGIDPMNFMDFIGRTSDLESIVRMILEVDSRVIVVKGSGGIGKTTTVKKAAYELIKRNYFNEGVSFISCDLIEDFKTFENKISECFALDHSINFREHILQEDIKKDSLIILDNFETLIYLTDIREIYDLVSFICNFCTLLITSREFLNVEFEEPYTLRQLTTDEAIELFGKKYDINKLNEIQYKILRFEIIENMLDNNPLAIKIIANNLPRGKNIKDLKQELELNFFDITTAYTDKLFYRESDLNIERIKSLYNSINYSYLKINEKEKIAFDSLAMFPDGIDLQNFKIYLNQSSSKKLLNKITDKELKSLENKSLVEINNGLIKLQSIIYRFANFQFDLRTKKEQGLLINNTYNYLHFVLENISDNTSYNTYSIFENNKNNFLRIMDNIERINDIDKINRLDFILQCSILFVNTKDQHQVFIQKLEKLKSYFSNLENGILTLDVAIQYIKYFAGSFDEAFEAIQNLIPFVLIKNIDIEQSYIKIIVDFALSIYSFEGFDYEILLLLIKKKYFLYNSNLHMYFFHLGMYSKIKHLIIDEYKDFDDDFFINEKKFNEAELSIDEIDISIKNTFEKQHLGLFNAYYVKAKLGQINKNQINKLVIINPYTLGLKYLILALAEKDNIRASELYMKSIENLKHIKYYHIEAIYFYAKHLKSIGCTDYCYWLSNGKELAKKYRYSFHNYKFRCLEHDVTEKFDDNEEIGFIYPELDNYIADVNDYSCSQIENKKKRSIVKNR